MCSVSEWLWLLPFLGVLAMLGFLAIHPFLPKKKQQKDSLINLKIQKENPKIVNEINIEDLCHTKAVYCRCWRSKTGDQSSFLKRMIQYNDMNYELEEISGAHKMANKINKYVPTLRILQLVHTS